jgi:hypothetical protein
VGFTHEGCKFASNYVSDRSRKNKHGIRSGYLGLPLVIRQKNERLGSAWRVLRTSSLTDQIFIKAQRIRTLEETGENKVGEGERDEFIGILNYSIMALVQIHLGADPRMELPVEEATGLFDQELKITKDLMMAKNHDYGEAWRDMRVSSFTDLILMKLLRIKQIEDNEGKTLVSEGIESGYRDIINYAAFALIKLDSNEK